MTNRLTHPVVLITAALIAVAGFLYAHSVHAAIFNFNVTPTTVPPGGTTKVTISWNAPDASCYSENFDYTGIDAGSVAVYPTQQTTYRMTCDGVTKSKTVTVGTPPPPPPQVTVDISVSPGEIALGGQALLTWSSTNATSCTVFDNWGYSNPSISFSSTQLNGSATVSPPYSGSVGTRYTISCSNNGGVSYTTEYVDLHVRESSLDGSCTVNDQTVRVGEPVTWTASGSGGNGNFTYSWSGEGLSGSGSSKTVTYSQPGEYLAAVEITSPGNGGGAWVATAHDNAICTGPSTGWGDSDTQDGGTASNMIGWAKAFAKSRFNVASFGPADFHINPQNYCMVAHVGQPCNPSGTQFGSGTCRIGVDNMLHTTRNYRATVSSDYNTNNGWTTDRYFGAITWDWVENAPETYALQCPVTVTVTANPPTATLTANPTSVIAGSASTLTAQCTNSTAGSINQGVGAIAVGSAVTKSVTPSANTTYTLTCTGQDGTTATAQTTVTVVPTLTASCSVSPTSITAGGTATWSATAAGGNGTYTYSFSDSQGAIGTVGPTTGTTASRAKSYATAGTYTGSVTVTSGTQSRTAACTNSLTVTTPLQPDLTAGATNVPAPTAGTAVTFTAPVSNVGNATSGSFPTRFQVANQAITSTVGNAVSGNITLAASGSQTVSGSYTFASTGTYNVRACANQNAAGTNIVTESNYGNNCGPWTQVTVALPAQPDLRVQAYTVPSTATAGVSTLIRATIRNYGTASTGAGFTNLFQRATSDQGAGATDIGTYQRATALGESSNFLDGINYAFPSAGTWYVRACADKSSAGNAGTITESDEANNCGGWVQVTVNNPVGSLSCNVSNQSPAPGTQVTYTVTPSGGASGPYSWNDSQGGSYGSGSTAVRTIPGAGPYVMSVNGQNTNGPASCPVVSGVCPNPSASITASPDRVHSGDSVTVSWSAQGVDGTCTITGSDGFSQTVTGASCTIPNGSTNRTITAQTTYRITCDGTESTAQVVVNLIPDFEEF